MLTIKRPSPTTVLYTVSTRSSNKTLAARIRRVLGALLRVLIGLFLSCLLVIKLHDSLSFHWDLNTFLASHFPYLSTISVTNLSWFYLSLSSLVVFYFIFRKGYTTESLLVIRGLGVQTTTSSPTYLSTATTRFIPTNMIQDIFIHEAFKGFGVRFYLAIVVEGEHDVVVVFPVGILLVIYIQHCF